jgi:general secretion pathway protein H
MMMNADKTRARGFTLVEVLVTMALMGLGIGLSTYALRPVRDRNLLSRTATAVVDAVALARNGALQTGRPHHLVFDPVRYTIDVPEAQYVKRLDGNVGLSLTTASEIALPSRATLLFLPDGTGSGGRITLRTNVLERTLRVSWLTGAVSHEP